MGTISVIVQGSTVGEVSGGIPAGGVQVHKTLSEQDSGRLVAALAEHYGDRWKDRDGSPRAPTIAEIVEAWVDAWVEGSVVFVAGIERERAAREAREGVTLIEVK